MQCDYGHELTGTTSPIHVPVQDVEGFPVLDETGAVKYETLRLPDHRAIGVPVSVFDPYGLSEVGCEHGLATHPDGRPFTRGGIRWVRAKHAKTDGRCVVDHGQPAPEDLATPANA